MIIEMDAFDAVLRNNDDCLQTQLIENCNQIFTRDIDL
jgi:hypothetical protein